MNPITRVTKNTSLLAGTLAVTLGLFTVESVQGSINITIQPADQEVTLGSLAICNVAISGLGSGTSPSLGTFDFNVRFNPGILSFDSISFGDPKLGDQLGLKMGSITGFSNDSIKGLVNQFELSLEMPNTLNTVQSDSFILTTLSFNTIGKGLGTFSILNVVLGDSQGDPLFADIIKTGSINVRDVTPIPEVNSVWLLVAFAAFCFIRSLPKKWKPLKN